MPKHPLLRLKIPPDLHTLLTRAAARKGQTLEEFVIESLKLASETEVIPGDVIHLSKAAQEAFAQAMLNPPSPNAAMKRALARHKKLLE
ncbi:type II toxin-antitoxin system TacA family antitoxin [Castellaniella ginsengisoli]